MDLKSFFCCLNRIAKEKKQPTAWRIVITGSSRDGMKALLFIFSFELSLLDF